MRWLLLILVSAALAAALEGVGLPAGLLLGPMVAAILFALRDKAVAIPAPLFYAAQAIVGCLIASSLGPAILPMLGRDWAIFLGATLSTLAASSLLGLLLARLQVLPGTVAIWGSQPGLATAMTLMARDYGADYRLVAFMAYLRVVCVAAAASLLALLLGGAHAGGVLTLDWFPHIAALPFAETLGIAAIGAVAGLRLGVPAGALLGPMILGGALNLAGLVRFELPEWLLAASYAIVGWRIGLRFTVETVRLARKALLPVLLSIALLIGFCTLIAWALVALLGVDWVSAYLATSPGGMDSVAIIAASTRVDLPFVMALQAVRLAAVLLFGPALARWGARRFDQARAAAG